MNSGVYKIINTLNQRIYIGSCDHFPKRKQQHFKRLEENKHHNRFLQHDFNKCGIEAFLFEVVEETENDKDIWAAREQFYLDQYYDNQKQCYNIRSTAVSTKNKSFSSTPEETRARMSEAKKGEKNNFYGKTHTEETRQKISETHKGKKKSGERLEQCINAGKSRIKSFDFKLVSPTGEIFGPGKISAREIVRKYNLSSSHVSKFLRRKSSKLKEWKIIN